MNKKKSTPSPDNGQLSIWQTPGNPFDAIRHVDDQGAEYWLARELMVALEYGEWRNFKQVLSRAKIAIETAGHRADYHIVDYNNMVNLGSGATRKITDFKLSRLACYLTAMNGDPSKDTVSYAQNYFAVQVRRAEITEEQKRLEHTKDVNAYRLKGFNENKAESRVSSKETQKQLTSAAYATHEAHEPDFAALAGAQNKGLFDMTRQEIIDYLGLLPRDEKNYRDHLGHYALLALTETNRAATSAMKRAGRALTSDEQVAIVKSIVHILAPSMRELAKFAGEDYLSGAELDRAGQPLIARNVKLLNGGK